MVIGIIGAGLSGLVAGKKLTEAGHEVKLVEKLQGLGGRLASLQTGEDPGAVADHGISHFSVHDKEFRSFVDELQEKGMAREWTHYFGLYDGINTYRENPNREFESYYVAPDGINKIPQYLSRWVDVQTDTQAGGITHIGSFRSKKRSWMINLTNIDVMEVDAVILASPAPEAYAVIQTAQNETAARKVIRSIADITYRPAFTVVAGYGDRDQPEWKGMEFVDDRLWWGYNEASKRDDPSETTLVLHSQPKFARDHRLKDPEEAAQKMLERLGNILDDWAGSPDWIKTHYWKYLVADNPMKPSYIEMEMEEAPLALVGDYLGGNTVESAYMSGLKLANHWIEKYKDELQDANHAKPLL